MDSTVLALAVSGSDLYVGGLFGTAGGVGAHRIAKWNGSTWSDLGGGIYGYANSFPSIFALAVSGGDLYAGGFFTTAGGIPANGIAKWNGSVWSALGAGISGEVHALTVGSGDLFAGGSFFMAGGVPANGLARWKNGVWSALGSGANGVGALAADASGHLFLGGGFTFVGTTVSPYLAQANPPQSLPSISIQSGATLLMDGSPTPINVGTAALGAASTKTFTITNTGDSDLTLGAISKDGINPADFANSAPLSSTVVPGNSTNFTITFTPGATGTRTATIRLASNITGSSNPFDINLIGTGATAESAFNTIATNSGLSGLAVLPTAIPFNDGVQNLLKYAFNMNLSGPDSHALVTGTGNSGLPSVGFTGTGPATMIRVEFLRRKGSGLTYTPKRSSTLEPGSFAPIGGTPVVTSIDDNWERVVVQESVDPATLPASFAVVEVTLPSP